MNEISLEPKAAVPAEEYQGRGLVEQMGNPVLLVGLDGEIRGVNRATCEIYGYEKREMNGCNFAMLRAAPAEIVLGRDLPDRLRHAGKCQSAEVHRNKSGATFDVVVTVSLFRDRRGAEAGLLIHISNYTEQRRRYDALRQVEKLYKMIVDTAQEGIWVIDADEKTSFVNQRTCDMLGYTVSEFMGCGLFDFLAPEYLERARHMIEDQRRGNRDSFEFCFKHKNGADVWLAIAASPLIDENDSFLGSLAMLGDITLRKNQEREREAMHSALLEKNAELEIARKKFEDLYDHAPCGYHTRSMDGVILEMNQTELNWLGYERDELVGRKDAPAIYTQDSFADFQKSLEIIKQTGEARAIQVTFLRKDGTTFPVTVDAIRVLASDGSPRIRASVYDVTEQRKAEALLEARRNKIEELNEKLKVRIQAELEKNVELENARRLFQDRYENAPCGYHSINDKGIIIEMNRTELDWLGYERGEVINKMHARDIIADESFPVLALALESLQKSGRAEGIQYIFKRKDGSTFPVSLNAIQIVNPDGHVQMRASVFDITEQKKTEKMLENRREEIEALNANLEERVQKELARNREKDALLFQQARLASIGEMVGNIAHQWRQPLNALQLLLVNIKDAYEFGELTVDVMNTSLSRGRNLVSRMSDTIDDFRHFFKPNKAREIFSPSEVVNGVLSIVSGEFKHHSIEICVHAEADVLVHGFPGEYSQVLLNLLGNARDAIVENDIAGGRIEIELYCDEHQAIAEIKDNGGGIPDHILPRIFEPYFSTKDEGKGTGIGLYMSKMIIEDHMNGRLEARSADGTTQFRVITPLPAASPS